MAQNVHVDLSRFPHDKESKSGISFRHGAAHSRDPTRA